MGLDSKEALVDCSLVQRLSGQVLQQHGVSVLEREILSLPSSTVVSRVWRLLAEPRQIDVETHLPALLVILITAWKRCFGSPRVSPIRSEQVLGLRE